MNYQNILVDIDGPVATITLNRPDKLNAINDDLLSDFEAALEELNPGDHVRVIRVRGAGRAFCSGYDLTRYPAPTGQSNGASAPAPGSPASQWGESSVSQDREKLRLRIERWLKIWNYRKPLIAQVHGVCYSGALDLTGACDIVFSGEDGRFGHPASRVNGLPVTLGMLPLRIGSSATKEFLFTGDTWTAADAHRLGMVDHVVPNDRLDNDVLEFCARIALLPLDVLTVHKHVTNRWSEVMGLRLAALESAEFDSICHQTPATREFHRIARADGVRAALAWRDGPFASAPGSER